jgi:uncharacterized membrane protein YdjX (TVP38/TMEM64 family)
LFLDLKNNHLITFIILFFVFSSLWVFLLGFGSPIALVSGFIFGHWLGTIVSVAAFTFGSGLLYLLAKYYFTDFIKKYLSNKIEKYKNLFNKNELMYFFIFRFVGGAGIPFPIQNVLPVVFDMKIKNYIYATFFGLAPTTFILNSLGSGINNLIEGNQEINYINVISNPGIYLPIISFIIILVISYFVKKKFFK